MALFRRTPIKGGLGLPIGGVWIDCDYAVIAHSDGDVLLHAIMDALLGALALEHRLHFPDTDPAYAGRTAGHYSGIVLI